MFRPFYLYLAIVSLNFSCTCYIPLTLARKSLPHRGINWPTYSGGTAFGGRLAAARGNGEMLFQRGDSCVANPTG